MQWEQSATWCWPKLFRGNCNCADTGSARITDQSWEINELRACPGVRAAVGELRQMGVQVPNIIHSNLIYSVTIRQQRSERAEVRCWSIRKPQNTTFLDDQPLDAIMAA